MGRSRGQTFNVTNGDVFEWRNLWPAIADTLGVKEAAGLEPILPSKSAVWDRIVRKHGLQSLSFAALPGESHHIAGSASLSGHADAAPAP